MTTRTTRREFLGTAIAATAAFTIPSALGAITSSSGRTGLQTIGLCAFSDAQIDITADIIANVLPGKDVGVGYLAYSFTQGANANARSVADFAKVSRLIQRALPKLPAGSKMMVETHLDDGSNRNKNPSWTTFRPDLSVNAFWQKVAANDGTLKSNWKANVATPFRDWSNGILKWASDNRMADRLRLDVCPVLEDRSASNPTYQNLVGWTTEVGLNSNIVLVRNPIYTNLPGDGQVAGVSRIEWHLDGPDSANARIPNLKAGYILSNDGWVNPTANGAQWGAVQKGALERNASAYLWRSSFNGDRDGVAPYNRGVLSPWAADTQASAIGWVRQRYGL